MFKNIEPFVAILTPDKWHKNNAGIWELTIEHIPDVNSKKELSIMQLLLYNNNDDYIQTVYNEASKLISLETKDDGSITFLASASISMELYLLIGELEMTKEA